MVAARFGSWRGPASTGTGQRWSPARPRCARLIGRFTRPGPQQLGPMFAELDELKLLAEAGQVAVLGEALSRGDVRASDAASPAGWVRQWGHSYAAGGAAALVAVTVAISQQRNRVLREAVLAARAPVRNAAVAIGRDGQAAAAADAGVPWHGAGRVRGAGRGAGAAGDPGAATRADRPVRAAGGVPAPRGQAQARHRPVPAVRRRRDPGVPPPPRPGGLRRPRGDPRPVGGATTEHGARLGHQDQRPAPRGRAGRGLPPRRRGRRGRAGHHEGGGVRDDELPGPGRADRSRDHPDRGPPRPRDRPADGLRRRDHPGRPRLAG